MLNGVPEFSDERLDQLVQFKGEGVSRFGIVCKPEMMMAVAREVATRCQENTGDAEGDFLKLTLSLDDWDDPHTFEMAGDKYRQEFARVAAVVEAKFTIKKLEFGGLPKPIPPTKMETLRMLAAQVGQQERRSLSMVKMVGLDANQPWEHVELLLKLIQASKEWVIQNVAVTNIHMMAPLGSPGLSKMIFAELGKCSATGHVGEVRLVHDEEEEQWLIKEDVRAVWEISEKVELFTFGQLGRYNVGGGRDKDTNVTWEEAYELLKMIC